MADQIKSLESVKLQLESEIQCLKLTVEHERSERRHYHSLANEILTRLDVVGQTIGNVVKRAEEETYRQHRELPHPALLDVKAPSFLEKVQARVNGNGEEATALP